MPSLKCPGPLIGEAMCSNPIESRFGKGQRATRNQCESADIENPDTGHRPGATILASHWPMPVLSEKPYDMPPGPIHSTNPTRILIVEDSATQAERLKYSLEQHGYHSSCARKMNDSR